MKNIVIAILAGVLVACAAGRQSSESIERIYQRHAGAHEDFVHYSSIRNWQGAGYEGVVVELNGGRHYLLGVSGPCDFELRTATTMKLINAQRNRISRFDRIAVGNEECRINSVRRVDMEAVRADLEAARHGDQGPVRERVEIEQADQESGGT